MNADRAWLALLVALPCTYFATLGRERMQRISALRAELAPPPAGQPEWEVTGARLEQLAAEREELERLAARVGDRLRPSAAAAPLILDAAERLRAHGIAAETIDDLPEDPHACHGTERVALSVRGAFVDLFRFVVDLENATPPSRVTLLSARTTEDGRTIAGNLTVERFWRIER